MTTKKCLKSTFSKLGRLGTLALALGLAAGAASAEDIDIYQGSAGNGGANLLIILDNSSATNGNLSFTCDAPSLKVNDPTKVFGFIQCGLYSALADIAKDPALKGNFNLGLMYFPPKGANGGLFVAPPPSPAPGALTLMDDTGLTDMMTRIAKMSAANDTTNNNQISQAMQEAWAFYQGKTGLSGTTYPGVGDTCARNFVLYISVATNNLSIQDQGTIGGKALQAAMGRSSLPPQTAMSPWPGAKAKPPISTDYSDEWAAFMRKGTLDSNTVAQDAPGITTYSLAMRDTAHPNPDYEQLMVTMADSSHGAGEAYVATLGNLQQLKDAIKRVIAQVRADNSVFAAPVLPVSANTQGTYANQIFMGMFRPDANAKPRWMGNLKQYRFGVDSTDPNSPQLFLSDASWGPYSLGTDGNRALSAAGTGFLSPTAVSYWSSKNTGSSTTGFWGSTFDGSDGFDSPDGQIVEKGGVSQQLRVRHLTDGYPTAASTTDASTRNMYTCPTSGCAANSLLSSNVFRSNNTALNDAALGTGGSTGVTALNLINWVRGEHPTASGDTTAGAETAVRATSDTTVRGSVHGDVLHSRPAVIDYGGTTGVVVFYGANDGLFRAVNGNQPNNPSDTTKPKGDCKVSDTCAISVTDAKGNKADIPPGGELWSFVAPEFYPGLQTIYKNTQKLTLGSTSGSGKPYFFDGAPGVYYRRATDTTPTQAYLFISARRGGRLIYALDVSDPTNPKFMWKRTNASTDYAELGQTWSQPKVARIKGRTNPVLIFGAGYDKAEDLEPAGADTMGRGIFIVDALTGDVIWRASYGSGGNSSQCTGNPCLLSSMAYAIPADLTLVDRDFDGLIDRIYAGDTGGNIWRVDLQPDGTGAVSTWQATLFAALGGNNATKRKFFYSPDVVPTRQYDAVAAITGDREHPLVANGAAKVINRFYMLKDSQTGNSAGAWNALSDNTSALDDALPTASSGLPLVRATAEQPYDGLAPGYFISLGNSGEKGVNAPTTVGGVVYFGTSQPLPAGSTDGTATGAKLCKPNIARSYGINFLTGKSRVTELDGGGLPPSPVFGMVTVVVDGKERKLPFLIGGGGGSGPDGKSPEGAEKPKLPLKPSKRRTYWYRETDR